MNTGKQFFQIGLLLVIVSFFALSGTGNAEELLLPFIYEDWTYYTTENSPLPDDHVFYVKVDGPRVWFGTEDGLACLEDGEWQVWKMEDGLPWKVISGIDICPRTGDVWIALFGEGVARYSAGRFDQWTQMNSGLINDVVYNVAVQDHYVWAATTAGASRYNTRTQEWDVYTDVNAPMHEIWNYNVMYDHGSDLVWLAVWGGGWLQFNIHTETWKAYVDPDGEMEYALFADDGPAHVITTGVCYRDGLMWGSTYFGVSRFDGRHWRGYFEHNSGLLSEFNNFIRNHNGEGWCCTDKGLSAMMDFDTNTWVNYIPCPDTKSCTVQVVRGTEVIHERQLETCIPNNFILGADFTENHDIWVATSHGVAFGCGKNYYSGLRPVSVTEDRAEAETEESSPAPAETEE